MTELAAPLPEYVKIYIYQGLIFSLVICTSHVLRVAIFSEAQMATMVSVRKKTTNLEEKVCLVDITVSFCTSHRYCFSLCKIANNFPAWVAETKIRKCVWIILVNLVYQVVNLKNIVKGKIFLSIALFLLKECSPSN